MAINTVSIVMPGDSRPTANAGVWPKAEEGLNRLLKSLKTLGVKADIPKRGFITTQAQSAQGRPARNQSASNRPVPSAITASAKGTLHKA